MGEVASAFVTLMPSAKGFGKGIGSQIGGDVAKTGQESGRNFGRVWASASMAPMRAVGTAALGLFAVDKAKDFLKGAVDQASDLNEAGTKLAVVFGPATASVTKFAAGGAKALGQSKLATLDAAATFGVYGKAAGLAGTANAAFSTKLVGLSTDLASFYNTDPSQAMEAIAAGLRGESEPLRQYGVLLDDATLRQEAMRLGLIKTTKQALTPQQKVLAAQSSIMKQTALAQGDFGRTSGGLANQQRILSAQFDNLKGTVGGALLPVVLGVVKALNNNLFPAFGKISSAISPVVDSVKLFIGSFTGKGSDVELPWMNQIIDFGAQARTVFDNIIGTVKLFIGAFTGKGSDVDLPWMNQVIDFGAQARAVFDKIVGIFGTVKDAVMGAFSGGGGAGGALSKFVTFLTGTLLPGIAGVIGSAVGYFRVVAPIVMQVVSTIVGVVQRNMPLIRTIIAQVFGTAADIVRAALTGIRTTIVVFSAIVRATWSIFGSSILGLIRNVFPAILGVIRGVLNIIQGVVRFFTAVLTGNWRGAWNALGQIVKGVWQVIGGVVRAGVAVLRAVVSAGLAAVRAVFSAGWSALKSIVSSAWSGIRNAVSSGASGMLGIVRGIPGSIKSALGNLGGMLVNAGKELIQGLISGITSKIAAIKSAMGKVAGAVKGFLPGSPVKEGPLRSWNNGGAGKRLVGLLADGLAYTGPVDSAMAQLASRVNGAAGAGSGQLAGLSSPSSAAAAGAAGGGTQVIQLVVDGRTLAEIVDGHMGRQLSYGRTGA